MSLTTHLDLLLLNEAITPLPLYAFTVCTQITVPLHFQEIETQMELNKNDNTNYK
jgi:hypothetical protein